MQIVVTGATGNVGTSLVDALGRDDRVELIGGDGGRKPEGGPRRVRDGDADIRWTTSARCRGRRRRRPPRLADPARS